MKTPEELNELKKEYQAVTDKLSELTEEELGEVVGAGTGPVAALPAGKVVTLTGTLGMGKTILRQEIVGEGTTHISGTAPNEMR